MKEKTGSPHLAGMDAELKLLLEGVQWFMSQLLDEEEI